MPKRIKRWDLLFIDEHGKVITFQYVRGLLISFVVVILALLAFAFYLYYLQIGANEKNADLNNTLEASRQEVLSLQQEVNALMVRLAEAQSNTPKSPSQKSSKPGKKASADMKKDKASSIRLAETRAESKKKAVSEQSGSSSGTSSNRPQSGTPSGTRAQGVQENKPPDVYDFLAFHDAGSGLLNARFMIKNPIPNSASLSGYLFVILKENDNDQNGWVPLPPVELVAGKPSQINEGQYFKIRNFKTVEIRSDRITGPKTFNKATVLEFSPSGELLLEKTFPVIINVAGIPAKTAAAEIEPQKPPKVIPKPEESRLPNAVEEAPDTEDKTREIILRDTQEETTGAGDIPAVTE